MFERELTWQATVLLLILFSGGACLVALLAAKVVKAWREALKK